MTQQHIRPNITTFAILMTASSELKDWQTVNQVMLLKLQENLWDSPSDA